MFRPSLAHQQGEYNCIKQLFCNIIVILIKLCVIVSLTASVV